MMMMRKKIMYLKKVCLKIILETMIFVFILKPPFLVCMAALVGVLVLGGTALTIGYISRRQLGYYFGYLQVRSTSHSKIISVVRS